MSWLWQTVLQIKIKKKKKKLTGHRLKYFSTLTENLTVLQWQSWGIYSEHLEAPEAPWICFFPWSHFLFSESLLERLGIVWGKVLFSSLELSFTFLEISHEFTKYFFLYSKLQQCKLSKKAHNAPLLLFDCCFWLFATPWTEPSKLLCPWDITCKNTGVGCHFLSRGSSWPRDQICVSCLAFITEPPGNLILSQTI